MNIGEKATILARSYSREDVLARANEMLTNVAYLEVDELVSGHAVAWLLAAAMVKTVINGAPRIITRVMDDGVPVTDRLG
jgi:hypothetical protein